MCHAGSNIPRGYFPGPAPQPLSVAHTKVRKKLGLDCAFPYKDGQNGPRRKSISYSGLRWLYRVSQAYLGLQQQVSVWLHYPIYRVETSMRWAGAPQRSRRVLSALGKR